MAQEAKAPPNPTVEMARIRWFANTIENLAIEAYWENAHDEAHVTRLRNALKGARDAVASIRASAAEGPCEWDCPPGRCAPDC